jgi:hypothetical protein
MGTKQSLLRFINFLKIISRDVITMISLLYPCPLLPKLVVGNEVNPFAFEKGGNKA